MRDILKRGKGAGGRRACHGTGLIDKDMFTFLILQSNCYKCKEDFLKMVGINHSNFSFLIISK